MRIDRIDLWDVAVPLPAPVYPSWIPGFRQAENRFTLIRLRTRDGIEGWSAVPSIAREREGLGSLLGPYFLGERADDIPSVRQRLRELGYLGLRCGWIEPACWDILGKARGKPVYELLGGRGGQVACYASTAEVRSGRARAREVEERLAEGFGAVKLRVHAATLAEDLAQIRETRRAVGDGAVLGVDANQAWRVATLADAPLWDHARAFAFCREAEELGYAWVEEPLPMDDYAGLAKLTASTRIPIAGGELNNQGRPEFETLIAGRCYDILQPDAVFTGGIAETWEIVERARQAGLRYTPHTWTNGIGFAVNLQLFAASPFRDALLEFPYDPPGWVPEARDGLLAAPWRHVRGMLALPSAPGLGFEIDRAALRRWGRRFYVGTKLRVALGAVRDRGPADAYRLGRTRLARLAARSRALDEAIAGGADPATAALARAAGP